MADRLYLWCVHHKTPITRLFWTAFILLFILIAFGYRGIILGAGNERLFSLFGRKAADIAVLFLVLTAIPGIARRFKISHKLIMILMLFRRQLGEATFIFALVHVCFITVFPLIRLHLPLIATNLQSLSGLGAFILLVPLFLTGNNFSVRRLGIWWQRIHRLTYLIIVVLAIHTYFAPGNWFYIAGALVLAEALSFAFTRLPRTGHEQTNG